MGGGKTGCHPCYIIEGEGGADFQWPTDVPWLVMRRHYKVLSGRGRKHLPSLRSVGITVHTIYPQWSCEKRQQDLQYRLASGPKSRLSRVELRAYHCHCGEEAGRGQGQPAVNERMGSRVGGMRPVVFSIYDHHHPFPFGPIYNSTQLILRALAKSPEILQWEAMWGIWTASGVEPRHDKSPHSVESLMRKTAETTPFSSHLFDLWRCRYRYRPCLLLVVPLLCVPAATVVTSLVPTFLLTSSSFRFSLSTSLCHPGATLGVVLHPTQVRTRGLFAVFGLVLVPPSVVA